MILTSRAEFFHGAKDKNASDEGAYVVSLIGFLSFSFSGICPGTESVDRPRACSYVFCLLLLTMVPFMSLAATAPAPIRLMHGPFEIVHDFIMIPGQASHVTQGNLPAKDRPVSTFSIVWHGKRISEGNRVFTLTDAQQPALIIYTAGVFQLIKEEQGQPVLQILNGPINRVSALQWLDADKGQPGRALEVWGKGDWRGESLAFSGGLLLLINASTVLDVQTLQSWPVDRDGNRAAANGFDASYPAYALSPGRTQIVLYGSRGRGDEYEDALFVLEFARNSEYAVPFDRSGTLFNSTKSLTQDWLAKYFVWSDEGGHERIRARSLVKRAP